MTVIYSGKNYIGVFVKIIKKTIYKVTEEFMTERKKSKSTFFFKIRFLS